MDTNQVECFISSDAGNSWQSHECFGYYPIKIGSDKYLSFYEKASGTSKDIFKITTNNGLTFSRILLDAFKYRGSVFSMGPDNSILYYVGNKIYRSNDLLQTSILFDSLPDNRNLVIQSKFDHIFVTSFESNRVFKSIDFGNSWQTIQVSNLSDERTYGVFEMNDSVTYFISSKTGNSSDSKLYLQHGKNSNITPVLDIFGRPIEFESAGGFGTIPMTNQGDTIIFCHGPNLARSTDGGLSWKVVARGGATGFHGYMDFSDHVSGVIGDNEFRRTWDGGLNWHELPFTLDVNDISMISQNEMMVYGLTTDTVRISQKVDLNLGSFKNHNNLTYSEVGNPVWGFNTHIDREVFTFISQPVSTKCQFNNLGQIVDSITSANSTTGYLTFKAIKGNENWISMIYQDGIYVKKPTEAWTKVFNVSNSIPEFTRTIDNPSHIIAVNEKIMISTDDGLTWNESGNNAVFHQSQLPKPIRVFSFSLSDIWVASEDQIGHTTDGGSSWSIYLVPDNKSVSRFWCTQPGYCFALAGDELYQTIKSLDIVGLDELSSNENNKIERNNQLVLYPNPSSQNTIQIFGNQKLVQLDLYSIEGFLLASYKGDVINQIELKSDMKSGVYIIKGLDENRKSFYGKLVYRL